MALLAQWHPPPPPPSSSPSYAIHSLLFTALGPDSMHIAQPPAYKSEAAVQVKEEYNSASCVVCARPKMGSTQ